MLKVGWFSSGGVVSRHLLSEAVMAIKTGDVPDAKIDYVFCNRELGESRESDRFLKLVLRFGVPLVAFSSAKFSPQIRKENPFVWRVCYHSELLNLLKGFGEDIRILAGYKLLLDYETCARKPTINLHPALPGGPKGTWQEVIWQLIGRGAKESGVTMHLVTPNLDSGPAITFCRFPIFVPYITDDLWKAVDLFGTTEHRQRLFSKIRELGLKREFPMIIETLRMLAKGEIQISVRQIVDKHGNPLDGGFDITEQIENQLRMSRVACHSRGSKRA